MSGATRCFRNDVVVKGAGGCLDRSTHAERRSAIRIVVAGTRDLKFAESALQAFSPHARGVVTGSGSL